MDVFRDFFAGFEGNYVIIGGSACDVHETNIGETPRATKDIDIILIVEAISREFVSRFWEFIAAGNYSSRQRGESPTGKARHEYFRFVKPGDARFPKQIELFSRNFGLIGFPSDAHITPIPAGEDLSSLSAILLDDDYYRFTIEHSSLVGMVHYASPESLICLKAKAFIDMTARKDARETVDKDDVDKHKKDVFRLIPTLEDNSTFNLPEKLENDMRHFLSVIENDLPGPELFRAMGFPRMNAELLVSQLRGILNL